MRRKDFGLAALFGASYDGKIDTQLHNSYLNIEKPFHPLIRGLENATRIVNGVNWVHVRPTAAKRWSPLTLVPSYPDLPMEEVFTRVPHTDIPGVYANAVRQRPRGLLPVRSRPHVLGCPRPLTTALLLQNAVPWAHGGDQPLSVTGKGMIDVSLWQQKGSITAHLVNLTNPMMMKGPLRELIPSPPQRVRIRLPHNKRVRQVQFLVNTAHPSVRAVSNVLEIEIPAIELHEAIAIDLG